MVSNSSNQSLSSNIDFHQRGPGTQKERPNGNMVHNKFRSNSTALTHLQGRPHSLGTDNVVKDNCVTTKNGDQKRYSCLEGNGLSDLTTLSKINKDKGDKGYKSNRTLVGSYTPLGGNECVVPSPLQRSVPCSDKINQSRTNENKNNGCCSIIENSFKSIICSFRQSNV